MFTLPCHQSGIQSGVLYPLILLHGLVGHIVTPHQDQTTPMIPVIKKKVKHD